MKILKEGNPRKAVISCHECECEMEYTNADMSEEYEPTYNSAITTYPYSKIYYIKCPCCKEKITVNKL